ncbi:MAG: GAF domain-containing protein [Burkholderiales bacterium]|nr:GAF domain-containing protein [Burkholderiales bacterium]MDE2276233.1 GAF domain-containing protein [Burkholderiales bacterium]
MLAAPLPDNESDRLQALRDLLILDTPPEQRFDRIAAFAASEFGVPIVLVSLVDSHRQWIKSRVGTDLCETERDVSFCGHAILKPQLFVVEDAWQDARFADNPLVTGPPHVRFYAGSPLSAPDGQRVGTLCLIDTRPRGLDAVDRAILDTLRALVESELAPGAQT